LQSDVLELVSRYPKLSQHLEAHPQDWDRMRKLVEEIHGDFSPQLVKTLTGIIEATFLKLYNGVELDIPESMNLPRLRETHHIVLVPNHQSHADYVALTYILFKNFELPVYVAGGINLNIFPIGKMFRKSGAFFIRRTFHDDTLYKLTFEGYISYLLQKNHMVEFFFEGGRTRTGKLMKPRYGLFQMLLEAHAQLNDGKPFLFIPVSLAHEVIPEARAHARELKGAKKEAENTTQLFKLFKLFNKRLGTIHVRFGEGIEVPGYVGEIKRATQELAFECFKAVGRGMPITPSSLIALVMLDEPSGALTWKQIEEKAREVIQYCCHLKIPITQSLKMECFTDSLRSALDMFIGNKKIDLIKREKLNQVFYAVKREARVEVLFHKNMILHHFLVPGFINAVWFKIFSGEIKTSIQLTKFLQRQRNELKYDFYLPSIKEMILHAREVVEYAVGRPLHGLDEALSFSPNDLYLLASRVRHFSTAFSYLYEAYYLSGISLQYLVQDDFSKERFLQVAQELFELELEHGRIVKYPEAYSVPILKDTLDYYLAFGVLELKADGKMRVINLEKLDASIEKFLRDLNDQVAINLKFNRAPSQKHGSSS
jgi:glycerol-3-phosphate O-acyltransferase